MSNTIANNQNFHVHSEAVNEMIEQGPGKFMQYGIFIFLMFVMLLIGLSWIIQYPDTERGACIIYADNRPRAVVGGTEGQLGSLFVSDGAYVRRNQLLGLIKSTAQYNDVLRLEALVRSCVSHIKQNTFEKIIISPAQFDKIGEFEGSFQHLYWTYRQLRSTIHSPLYKYVSMESELVEEGIKSPAVITGESRNFEQQFYELLSEFMHTINDILSAISLWKQKYVLTAPIEGKVLFPEVVFQNKEITAGQEVFYIDPPVKNYYGQVTLNQHSYSKIKKGQPVVIELEGRSENEEPLHGHVSHVSPILNKDGTFVVKVMFNTSQVAGVGQPVHFMNEWKGSGIIITNKGSLLSRIVHL